MVVATYSLREDYWDTFEIVEADIEFLYQYLLEVETPLTPRELTLALVKDRIRREKRAIEQRRSAGGEIYKPMDRFELGQTLTFPALNWRQGKVIGRRDGRNSDLGEFGVIQVEFDGNDRREFADSLENHRLNQPIQVAEDEPLLDPEVVMATYGDRLSVVLEGSLKENPEAVIIAGRWFLQALLVDVNMGHLNLAEAMLDMEGGGPLPTSALLEQVELPTDVNPKLVEFSLDLALQDDERFDEVGPAGKVLWFLRRLEPEGARNTPMHLRYRQVDYDRTVLSEEMLALERALDDELAQVDVGKPSGDQVELRLIYPHWRAGTLPLSERVRYLFPTAYEAPRIRFILIDGESGDPLPGWVVRKERYVYGLNDWYRQRGLMPGSLLAVRPGNNPGEVIVQADTHRSTREWVRTVLVGADGGVVMAMLKQVVMTNFDERMAIAIPDAEALDKAAARIQKERVPFERIVVDVFRELAKLNPQQHVHASELYAAVNLLRRCPPGPILALLASRPWFAHVGDFYYRLSDFDGA